MEPSDQGTAEQQWSEARAYWNTLRSLWAIQAQNRDVIDPALTQPTLGELAKSMKLNTHASNKLAQYQQYHCENAHNVMYMQATHNTSKEMLDHHGTSLSEQHTIGFIICYGTQTMHARSIICTPAGFVSQAAA